MIHGMEIHGSWLNHAWQSMRCQPGQKAEIVTNDYIPKTWFPCKTNYETPDFYSVSCHEMLKRYSNLIFICFGKYGGFANDIRPVNMKYQNVSENIIPKRVSENIKSK